MLDGTLLDNPCLVMPHGIVIIFGTLSMSLEHGVGFYVY